MTWLAGHWLWALLAVPLLAAAILAWTRSREAAARAYADPRVLRVGPPLRARRLRAAALATALGALAFAVVAMARPAVDRSRQEGRSTVMLAMDVSLSMLQKDLAPTRLRAAVEAADRFLDVVPDSTAVGLILFSDGARVVVPPVTDRDAVRRALPDRDDTRKGTAIGDAVDAGLGALRAAGALRDPPATPQDSAGRILVLTDGANTTGLKPAQAAERAAAARVPVYTVLMGDDPGLPNEPTPAEALAGLSRETGGIATATSTTEDLRRVVEDIGEALTPVRHVRELSVWAALIALGLLLAAAGIGVMARGAMTPRARPRRAASAGARGR